ncbi:MAG: glycosyltransferase family 2 protein [Bacteroidales bacterium]|nr:glycosyltransferase family 2 protein [Lentimicrobiaceae bacterium]MDD5695340.1 glycosyltransferase family 2 protein [Bacteroidales bacterium]
MDLSVVIPLYNEQESLTELSSWIGSVLKDRDLAYEILFVDDGSTDGSWETIMRLSAGNEHIKGIRFRRNYGKSAALHQGFQACSGEVVITMDADLQDSPDEIPVLYDMIAHQGYDLVSGWKKRRYDPFVKRITSRIYNWTTRRMSGLKLHDMNCGLKAYRSEVVRNIEVYGEMHRYIPVIAHWAGFRRIGEKVVAHRKRKYGVTKFGMDRFMKGYLDLLSITFVSRFGRRPMHLFGSIGTILFIVGMLAAIYLGAQKIYYLNHGIRSVLIADSPYFYISLVTMIMGTQLFLTGFLAEMISRAVSGKPVYQVEKMTGFAQ